MLKLLGKNELVIKLKHTVRASLTIDRQRHAKASIFAAHEHLNKPLSSMPEPQVYEPLWADFWRASYIFSSRATKPDRPHFSLLFPPPNITGNVHLGHALTLSLQDAYVRHQRMQHDANVAFIPGYDHAGIATFLQLEKFLKSTQGKNIREIDEAEFSQFFALWKESRINEIRDQLDRLGAAFDHHREYFTLDPSLCGAVAYAFIRLHEKGLIKRENAQVMWSYAMKSTVSDVEVKKVQINGRTQFNVPGIEEPVDFGLMHTFLFPLDDARSSGEGIRVSTMNLYSIPGDVAVAVHPNDSRYTKYHNKLLYNPISGKPIPVILDEVAKMDFATGAVKITPASSPVDYEVAVRHRIPFDNFMNEDGTIMEDCIAPQLSILKKCKNRYEATKVIQQLLVDMGLYQRTEERSTVIPFCPRSGDVIERRIKPQWFLDTKPGYELLRTRINNGTFEIIPNTKTNILLEWLKNPRDWCISRQIPFGHQIPAYKMIGPDGEKVWIVARSLKKATQKALDKYHDKEMILEQDKDVLDTWFSSALLPLSALDWPKVESPYFKFYYPLSLMETGYDILNFWVMKMVILSTYLTGMMPFDKVYLHGMVCDARGKKMSKSLGNAINPIDVISGVELETLNNQSKRLHETGLLSAEEYANALHTQKNLFPRGIVPCGADGLRLSLYEHNPKTDKMSYSVQHLESNRSIINKIWQAYRFFDGHSKRHRNNFAWFNSFEELIVNQKKLSILDRWILSRLSTFLEGFKQDIGEFSHQRIYRKFLVFWLSCFCDIYLEGIKPEDRDQPLDPLKINILAQVINATLLAMHPLIPFITEELFQRLKRLQNPLKADIRSIALERFPDLDPINQFHNAQLEEEMSILIACKKSILNFKSECSVNSEEMKTLKFKILTKEIKQPALFKLLSTLIRCPNVSPLEEAQIPSFENWIQVQITERTCVFIEPSDQFFQPFMDRLNKKILTLQERISKTEARGETAEPELFQSLTRLKADRDHLTEIIAKRS